MTPAFMKSPPYPIQRPYARMMHLTADLLNVSAAIVDLVNGQPGRERTRWTQLMGLPGYKAAEMVILTLVPDAASLAPAIPPPAQSVPSLKTRRFRAGLRRVNRKASPRPASAR